MHTTEYNDYLTALVNLDGPALYVEQDFDGIDADLDNYYNGREV